MWRKMCTCRKKDSGHFVMCCKEWMCLEKSKMAIYSNLLLLTLLYENSISGDTSTSGNGLFKKNVTG